MTVLPPPSLPSLPHHNLWFPGLRQLAACFSFTMLPFGVKFGEQLLWRFWWCSWFFCRRARQWRKWEKAEKEKGYQEETRWKESRRRDFGLWPQTGWYAWPYLRGWRQTAQSNGSQCAKHPAREYDWDSYVTGMEIFYGKQIKVFRKFLTLGMWITNFVSYLWRNILHFKIDFSLHSAHIWNLNK